MALNSLMSFIETTVSLRHALDLDLDAFEYTQITTNKKKSNLNRNDI